MCLYNYGSNHDSGGYLKGIGEEINEQYKQENNLHYLYDNLKLILNSDFPAIK